MEDVREMTSDVISNMKKILHQGKRANGIVKGMLMHIRSNKGEKEATNINALVDEYLRLAYHGSRAKDETFNGKLETNFDQTIRKIETVPQDIGQVILNLITNAFQTVSEKSKFERAGYQPLVIPSTEKCTDHATITMRDNGNGIPPEFFDKIFQPFFTTKATGQETGLDLSVSYDIIKAHGGEIKMESQIHEGSVFTIFLPIKNQIEKIERGNSKYPLK